MFNLIQNFLSNVLQTIVLRVSLIEINTVKNILIRIFIKNYEIEFDDYPEDLITNINISMISLLEKSIQISAQ